MVVFLAVDEADVLPPDVAGLLPEEGCEAGLEPAGAVGCWGTW